MVLVSSAFTQLVNALAPAAATKQTPALRPNWIDKRSSRIWRGASLPGTCWRGGKCQPLRLGCCLRGWLRVALVTFLGWHRVLPALPRPPVEATVSRASDQHALASARPSPNHQARSLCISLSPCLPALIHSPLTIPSTGPGSTSRAGTAPGHPARRQGESSGGGGAERPGRGRPDTWHGPQPRRPGAG